ncbi:MAG: hypothetical protein ING19_17320 [Azospirillum sp.]|nr:hypothetical protein [Azospirillum sp.]
MSDPRSLPKNRQDAASDSVSSLDFENPAGVTILTPADAEAFAKALDAKPTEALRAAFKRHRETILSRG